MSEYSDWCDDCAESEANPTPSDDAFKRMVLQALCAGAGGGGGPASDVSIVNDGDDPVPTKDWEILCDEDGVPVFVRLTYNPAGVVNGTEAYSLDGTPYAGVVADLVACGGGGSEPVECQNVQPCPASASAPATMDLTLVTSNNSTLGYDAQGMLVELIYGAETGTVEFQAAAVLGGQAYPILGENISTGIVSSSATTSGLYRFDTAGVYEFVIFSPGDGSGTIDINKVFIPMP